MNKLHVDIAIIGAGFGGSLCALLAHQIGKKTVLIERGQHPRFTIGESSTPIADLILKQLANEYDLPQLIPFCDYGSWKKTHPEISCGLKRGFSYFKHADGKPFAPDNDHRSELLVTASPDDERGDAHWFRADFDHFLVREVQNAGIHYFDETRLENILPGEHWKLEGVRHNQKVNISADFVIDASGNSSVIAKALGLKNDLSAIKTNSRTLYSHFTGVNLWQDVYDSCGGISADHPFPSDASALHHIFDGGWMWVLRFENGITSAGFVLDCEAYPIDSSRSPEEEWASLLKKFPSIQKQFNHAKLVQPFCRTERMQRKLSRIAGPIENGQPANWVLLPYTACFLDPLHSSGNAHTLSGIERLFRVLRDESDQVERAIQLLDYERTIYQEVAAFDTIIRGCYTGFKNFELLTIFSMLYFAGAIHSEHRRIHNQHLPTDAFLNSHDENFLSLVVRSFEKISRLSRQSHVTSDQLRQFQNEISVGIEPYNIAGLCDPAKKNIYPYV